MRVWKGVGQAVGLRLQCVKAKQQMQRRLRVIVVGAGVRVVSSDERVVDC